MLNCLLKMSIGLVMATILFVVSSSQQGTPCECQGQLIERTFERQCASPVQSQVVISNSTCNLIEVPEGCFTVMTYEVVGSECAQLPWTPEFALGRGTRNLCFSQTGLPPCKELVRWIRLTLCEQRQCIDCIEGEPPSPTARWCRSRLDVLYEWNQFVRDLQFCLCDPIKVPVIPIQITRQPLHSDQL
jgi:hypothetical protein